ncbi:hypothetical protein K9N68_19350 [Kovacikia minuta CCNUW1]|uniref:hypothetical protein n=1 Tax=Kovacikia minuta TaxID=2931930 RepID=UPI001CCEE0C1|nr:hypothetical protein [Kovacikia minuta]UBF23903.1 hypothetical protein K9N68_19350 [Kovacikia minuta CCNUW1]
MTPRTIATTALLATLLLGGISACNRSNSADTPPSEASPSSASQSDTSQPDTARSQDRAQRREAMKKKIEAVLTPEQVKQLESKLQQGERMRDAMASLDLTSEQKTKIREIYKSARAQRQEQSPTNSQ